MPQNRPVLPTSANARNTSSAVEGCGGSGIFTVYSKSKIAPWKACRIHLLCGELVDPVIVFDWATLLPLLLWLAKLPLSGAEYVLQKIVDVAEAHIVVNGYPHVPSRRSPARQDT